MICHQIRSAFSKTTGFHLTWVMLALCLCACSTPPSKKTSHLPPKSPRPYFVMGKWYQPLPHARNFSESGLASWYGQKFHGRKTANGEIYDMYGITAAHKTLPLGTYVRVVNRDNQRQLDVRINDRGPFVSGRIIDLSYGAAKKLGVLGPGTARVEITALGTPAKRQTRTESSPSYTPGDYFNGHFTIQVGAFGHLANAKRLKRKLTHVYNNAHISVFQADGLTLYRVRVGRSTRLDEAKKYEQILKDQGFINAMVVAEDLPPSPISLAN
jgi:rare lipoprotein A